MKSFFSVTNFRRTMIQTLISLPAPRSRWWVQSPPLNLLLKNGLWSVQPTTRNQCCLFVRNLKVPDLQGWPNGKISSGITGRRRHAFDQWHCYLFIFIISLFSLQTVSWNHHLEEGFLGMMMKMISSVLLKQTLRYLVLYYKWLL